jgi:hypothetical protein
MRVSRCHVAASYSNPALYLADSQLTCRREARWPSNAGPVSP